MGSQIPRLADETDAYLFTFHVSRLTSHIFHESLHPVITRHYGRQLFRTKAQLLREKVLGSQPQAQP